MRPAAQDFAAAGIGWQSGTEPDSATERGPR